MIKNFKAFASAIAKQFAEMSKHELYRVGVEGDAVWELYLASFPEGTNPIFRVRTEHDGSYDRHTVRRVGNLVALINGLPVSIWDAPGLKAPYSQVAGVLADKVRRSAIAGLFRTRELSFGHEATTEKLDDGGQLVWNHFHVKIDKRHRSTDVATVLGDANTAVQVFKRGLEELTRDSLATISELIEQGTLYRGAEHKAVVEQFSAFHLRYNQMTNNGEKQAFLWQNYTNFAAKFRNTVIGSLAIDLSAGVDEEQAVRSFEQKVAPTNYKRPTALITAGMVKQSLKVIEDLGLEPALERRYATAQDLSVNNVLWVSYGAQAKMKDGIAALLDSVVTKKASPKAVPEVIGVEEFFASVVPQVRSMEILVEGRLQKNLVSLTAPVHADAKPLFKWDNGFAWSYNGEITDAIKERVKAAGGNIQADLRVSLAWYNFDDLDLHTLCPYGHVFYGNKLNILDVDMNAGHGTTRQPVENLAFIRPRDGHYSIDVNQFSRRETTNPGFVIEIECGGAVEQFSYELAVTGTVKVAEFDMHGGQMLNLKVGDKSIRRQGMPQQVWGISTESYVPVATVLHSPNHWDGKAVGNKHTFFMLEGCANPESTRGIYNEFLRSDLEPHRKVFEVLGSKTKCAPSAEQLAGLGFSSTVREAITVHVSGQTINKLYRVSF